MVLLIERAPVTAPVSRRPAGVAILRLSSNSSCCLFQSTTIIKVSLVNVIVQQLD